VTHRLIAFCAVPVQPRRDAFYTTIGANKEQFYRVLSQNDHDAIRSVDKYQLQLRDKCRNFAFERFQIVACIQTCI